MYRLKAFLLISVSLIVADIFLLLTAFSKENPSLIPQKETSPQQMQWTVGEAIRKALVYIPETAKTKATPVIFAFHGHGGTMENMYKTRAFDKLWPEAIFICPQGLNTPGQLTDPEGKRTGWQSSVGSLKNRDIIFFDAMLKTLSTNYKVDPKRIYVTGHSNGGGFTYLLWAERGNVFAAVAPTATAAPRLINKLQPKPALHLMGEKDPLVKPEWQKFTYNAVLKMNKCASEGEKLDKYSTYYKSETGNPVQLFIHPGGHQYPQEANNAIIKFFKGFVKP